MTALRIRAAFAGVFALALVSGPVAATEAAPAAAPAVVAPAASPRSCLVTLAGTAYGSLAEAEAVATDGATLSVRGTCLGTTVIDTSVTILGVRNATSGVPTLSGDKAGPVLIVRAGTEMTIRGLTIRDGRNGKNGGAIVARSAYLVLEDTVVRASMASRGGGIWAEDSDITLRGASAVRGNRAIENDGGGIYAYASTVRMEDTSRISGNTSRDDDGGGIRLCGGRLEMTDRSRINHNVVIDDDGAGVYASGCEGTDATILMTDDARIDHNSAIYDDGGGIFVCYGSITMENRASIDRNTAEKGGGIDLSCGGTLSMSGSSRIVRNTAGDAGGLYVCSEGPGITVLLEGSSGIRRNIATEDGGGVMLAGCGESLRVIGDAEIAGNSAELDGGGIIAYNSPVLLEGAAAIRGNDAGRIGGGIFWLDTANLTMTDTSVIRGNVHAAAENGAGVSSCGQSLSGVTALTNVLDNLAPNGPIGNLAATQIWDRCAA